MSKSTIRRCHRPAADACGDGFVAVVKNRGRKFVTEGNTLTSSKGGAKRFATQMEALSTSREYIASHFPN